MLQITPQERLALGVTVLLLGAGVGVRTLALRDPGGHWEEAASRGDTTAGIGALHALRERAEAERAREVVRRTPLAEGERLDPNRAGPDELDRLPRVGPALARRIVEWRRSRGAFRTLADLDSVPGVGPALLRQLAPHLTLPAAPAGAPEAGARVDLNRATAAELEALPGVGPVLAERILAWRGAHGPFRSIEELDAVPGVGPALLARLAPRLRVTP